MNINYIDNTEGLVLKLLTNSFTEEELSRVLDQVKKHEYERGAKNMWDFVLRRFKIGRSVTALKRHKEFQEAFHSLEEEISITLADKPIVATTLKKRPRVNQ